jgi:hypothetical protein
MNRLAVLAAVLCLAGCAPPTAPQSNTTQPAPSAHSDFPPEFHATWKPGYVETLEYEWTREEIKGRATMRTQVENGLLRMDVAKRGGDLSETVSVWMALRPSGVRPAGTIQQVSVAWQAPGVNDYTQMDLANTSALAFRLGNPAWQRQYVVAYPAPGFPGEAFLLWARRFAWPRIRIGSSEIVTALVPLSRTARAEPRAASLNLHADGSASMGYDGERTSFVARIYRDFPHRIREWTTADGEKGRLIEQRTATRPTLEASPRPAGPSTETPPGFGRE